MQAISSLEIGQSVTIAGWVEKVKTFRTHEILIVSDGPGSQSKIQVIHNDLANSITLQSYVQITGNICALPKNQYSFRPFELQATSVTILGPGNNAFAGICPPDAGVDVKLAQRHIHLRNPRFALVTILRSKLVDAIRAHFAQTNVTEIHPPLFVGNQCEGGATLFKLQYPARDTGEIPAYLTQSSQFYLEYALPALGNTYCITTSFRAERSHTRRHLTEFLHAECEWSHILTFEDHLQKLRELVKGILVNFAQLGANQLEELGLQDRMDELILMCDDMVVLEHREAIDYCLEHGIVKDDGSVFEYSDDIPEMQERRMIDDMGKIVLLTKFPTKQKSFYFARDPDNEAVAWGCDVEFPGVGECIGSGVRLWDADALTQSILENGLNVDDYREYIDLRRYGSGRTSGMGLGVDRLLTWLLGYHSIRDVVTFPRYPGHLTP
jgi:asparaginyl-tRNA synthetase